MAEREINDSTGNLRAQAIRELDRFLSGGLVRDVRQLGEGCLLLFLNRRGERHTLAAGVEQGTIRLHVLFEQVHREYLRRTQAARSMDRHLSGGAVRGAFACADPRRAGVLLSRGGATLRLLVDAASDNLVLCGPDGSVAARLREEGSGSCACEEYPGSGDADDLLPANRALSREFFERWNRLLHRSVSRVLKTEEKKVVRLLEKLREEGAELDRREELREKGELLKTGLHRVEKGKGSVLLLDHRGRRRRVELDPSLDPRQNMDRYFARYKKLKRKVEVFDRKLSFERERLSSLRSLLHNLEEGGLSLGSAPSLFVRGLDPRFVDRKLEGRIQQAVRRCIGTAPAGRLEGGSGSQAADRRRGAFLRLQTRAGTAVLAGRNARENDQLTLRTARGNDLWFHVEGGSGSHVVLRYVKGREFLDQDIRDASQLALYFSACRSKGAGTVVYTRCKNLRKPKGAREGAVLYHHHKSRDVELDQELLDRLLGASDRRP